MWPGEHKNTRGKNKDLLRCERSLALDGPLFEGVGIKSRRKLSSEKEGRQLPGRQRQEE